MLDSITSGGITLASFLACTVSSIVLGILAALTFMYKSRQTSSFSISLAILPATVQIVIMMVNGNLGAGIAVAGAFSLVRFRSVPGSAREIAGIFVAMAIGLALGMGYIGIAFIFFVIIAALSLILSSLNFGGVKSVEKNLKVTIPENLDYEGLFDDLFAQYTTKAELYSVRTTNMGTIYELSYHIMVPGDCIKKEFIDKLRCRNGNLNIVCGRIADKEAL